MDLAKPRTYGTYTSTVHTNTVTALQVHKAYVYTLHKAYTYLHICRQLLTQHGKRKNENQRTHAKKRNENHSEGCAVGNPGILRDLDLLYMDQFL